MDLLQGHAEAMAEQPQCAPFDSLLHVTAWQLLRSHFVARDKLPLLLAHMKLGVLRFYQLDESSQNDEIKDAATLIGEVADYFPLLQPRGCTIRHGTLEAQLGWVRRCCRKYWTKINPHFSPLHRLD
jgi:hypothetical protein